MMAARLSIALSLAIMTMRKTTFSIQTSVYVVDLLRLGLVGTTIGVLFAAAAQRQLNQLRSGSNRSEGGSAAGAERNRNSGHARGGGGSRRSVVF